MRGKREKKNGIKKKEGENEKRMKKRIKREDMKERKAKEVE